MKFLQTFMVAQHVFVIANSPKNFTLVLSGDEYLEVFGSESIIRSTLKIVCHWTKLMTLQGVYLGCHSLR